MHVTDLDNMCLYFCAVGKIYMNSKDHMTFGLVTHFDLVVFFLINLPGRIVSLR